MSITAYGAQGTPQRTKCAFSAARSWQIATASAPGATGRVRAQRAQRGGRHVLELGGDGRAALHQLRQALLVEVVGLDVVVATRPAGLAGSGSSTAVK